MPDRFDEILCGAIDGHVHACAHLNARSLTAWQAARQAQAAGMRAIGLMDNFASSVGIAAMIDRELADPGFTVFGGLILEPQAGGLNPRAVAAALATGYPDAAGRDWRGGRPGGRFISFPTHATRHVAQTEGRQGAYLEACLALPDTGPLPDPIPEILDLIAAANAVLNTGHLSAPETLRLIEAARARGITRIIAPCSLFPAEAAEAIVAAGAVAEFSYFFVSPATQVPLTHVDAEAHLIPATTLAAIAATLARLPPAACVVSGDCGVSVLPAPVKGLAVFLRGLAAAGVAEPDLRVMTRDTPARLFGLD
jgi:hypothetical protein